MRANNVYRSLSLSNSVATSGENNTLLSQTECTPLYCGQEIQQNNAENPYYNQDPIRLIGSSFVARECHDVFLRHTFDVIYLFFLHPINYWTVTAIMYYLSWYSTRRPIIPRIIDLLRNEDDEDVSPAKNKGRRDIETKSECEKILELPIHSGRYTFLYRYYASGRARADVIINFVLFLQFFFFFLSRVCLYTIFDGHSLTQTPCPVNRFQLSTVRQKSFVANRRRGFLFFKNFF